MTRFDFLHRQPALRIPELPVQWRGCALIAVACTAILFVNYRIQSIRLSAATALEAAYDARLAQTEQAAQLRSKEYRGLRGATDLLRRAALVAQTAKTQARVITTLTKALPPHVWLTAIRRDPSGVTVEGKAASLPGVAALIRNLSVSTLLAHPQLTSISRPDSMPSSAPQPMTYALHVDVATQS